MQLARSGHGGVADFWHTRDCAVMNLTVYASPGLVVGCLDSDRLLLDGIRTIYRDERRLLTANADGIHCQSSRQGPVVQNCLFTGMADDGLNVLIGPTGCARSSHPPNWKCAWAG